MSLWRHLLGLFSFNLMVLSPVLLFILNTFLGFAFLKVIISRIKDLALLCLDFRIFFLFHFKLFGPFALFLHVQVDFFHF